jgi:hypothetical protein
MGLICLVEIGEVRRVKCVHVRAHVRVLCCIQMRAERETDIMTRNVQSLCLRSLAVTLPCTEPPEKDEPCEATERDGARLEVGVPGFEAPPSERVIFCVVFISARCRADGHMSLHSHCSHSANKMLCVAVTETSEYRNRNRCALPSACTYVFANQQMLLHSARCRIDILFCLTRMCVWTLEFYKKLSNHTYVCVDSRILQEALQPYESTHTYESNIIEYLYHKYISTHTYVGASRTE